MPPHPLRTYRTLDEFLTAVLGVGYSKDYRHYRFWIAKWVAWKARHPGLPYRIKCPICSGKEQKISYKLGWWKNHRSNWRKDLRSEDGFDV